MDNRNISIIALFAVKVFNTNYIYAKNFPHMKITFIRCKDIFFRMSCLEL